jgi:hypothetical protein
MKTAFRLWTICPDDTDEDGEQKELSDNDIDPDAHRNVLMSDTSDRIWQRADTTPQVSMWNTSYILVPLL